MGIFDDRFGDFPQTARRFRSIEALHRAAAKGRRRVLDLGAGTGRLSLDLEAEHVVALDASRPMIAQAAAKGVSSVLGDAHSLPFAAGAFDAVVAGNCVSRYFDYEPVLAECFRVLRPGGKLVLHQYAYAPLYLRWWRQHERNPNHVASLDELTSPAEAAGFQVSDLRLWRTLSRWPHLVRVPVALARSRLWTHVSLELRRSH